MELKYVRSLTCAALLALLAGCASRGEAPASSAPAVAGKSQPAGGANGQSSSASSASGGIAPGMNERGEVVDSSKVEAGRGTKVKMGDVEGEITGKAAPGSKFNKLKIGMKMKQVTGLIGQPSDQGAYITGKAFIPFYFGDDRHRYELVYKGAGRLIFAGEGGWGWSWGDGTLIWIIHNAHESGSR